MEDREVLYVRTNDSIYKVSKVLKDGSYLIYGKFHLHPSKVIKCSTQLDDLLDKVVEYDLDRVETFHIYDLSSFHSLLTELPSAFRGSKKLYGSIWVFDRDRPMAPRLVPVVKYNGKEFVLFKRWYK